MPLGPSFRFLRNCAMRCWLSGVTLETGKFLRRRLREYKPSCPRTKRGSGNTTAQAGLSGITGLFVMFHPASRARSTASESCKLSILSLLRVRQECLLYLPAR